LENVNQGAQLVLRIAQNMDLLAVNFFALSPALACLFEGGLNIRKLSSWAEPLLPRTPLQQSGSLTLQSVKCAD
jgi:hypothetical protein